MLQYVYTRVAAIRILKYLKAKKPIPEVVLFEGKDVTAKYAWALYSDIVENIKVKSHTVEKAVEILYSEKEIDVLHASGRPNELKLAAKGDMSLNDRKYHFQIWDVLITYYLPVLTMAISIIALWFSIQTQLENSRLEQRINAIEQIAK